MIWAKPANWIFRPGLIDWARGFVRQHLNTTHRWPARSCCVPAISAERPRPRAAFVDRRLVKYRGRSARAAWGATAGLLSSASLDDESWAMASRGRGAALGRDVAMLRPKGPTCESPGRRPGQARKSTGREAPTGRALGDRKPISPFQGCGVHITSLPRAALRLPWAIAGCRVAASRWQGSERTS